MTKAYFITGRLTPVQSFLRTLFLIGVMIGGFFIFVASAAFALFVALGLLIFGVIVFSILWVRAKLLGKPITPFGKMQAEFESFSKTHEAGGTVAGSAAEPVPKSSKTDADGPVIDAHQTPEGWSVDSD
ncbi:MAG: hypothetical protein V3U57_04705 [Robiginitomaculum sp.]